RRRVLTRSSAGETPALLFRSLAILRPRTLERAPEQGVTQAEPVPPEIEHLPVTAEHAVARYARGRGDQRRKTVVHPSPISSAQAREQVPQRKRSGSGVRPSCGVG